MKINTRLKPSAVSHHDREVAELRVDRELAAEYLNAAIEALDNPSERAGGLIALRTVSEACGGLATVAEQAGQAKQARLSAADHEALQLAAKPPRRPARKAR